MSCVTSAHAKQTILRGCCTTVNSCCQYNAAYSATKYCECNDTVGDNHEISFEQDLCTLLTTGFTGQIYGNSTAFYTALAALDYSPFICGEFEIYVVPSLGGDEILVGTVFNGDITTETTVIPGAEGGVIYNLIIGSGSTTVCGTMRRDD